MPVAMGIGTLLMLSVGWHSLTARGATPDMVAMEQMIRDSQVAEQTLDIAPIPAQTSQLSAQIPAASIALWKGQIANRLGQLYTGVRLQQMTKVMTLHANEQQGNSSIEVGGGVDSLTFEGESVTGTSATARFRVVKYLTWDNYEGRAGWVASTIRGVAHFADALVKTPQGWRIASEDILSFGDKGGSGP